MPIPTSRPRGLSRMGAALILSVAILGSQVGAASAQGSAEERRACTPDVNKLCSELIPDADKITACLKAKSKQLSPACRKVMSTK